MTYATVMVSLALDQPNEARLEAAGQIAERFDAGIIGIAASQFSPPLYFTSGELAQDLIDEGQASIKKRIGELEAQFREAMKNRARHVEWRSAIDFPARYILREARCADIIVSGGDRGALSDPLALASPKDLVMQAGRPLLDRARFRRLARSAKRAGGMEGHDGGEAGDRRCAADAAQGQGRHRRGDPGGGRQPVGCRLAGCAMSPPGCHVTAFPPRNAWRRRMRTATRPPNWTGSPPIVGAGLIVAGAYGHSRFRELILGGMTQHLITQSARCVLLSH